MIQILLPILSDLGVTANNEVVNENINLFSDDTIKRVKEASEASKIRSNKVLHEYILMPLGRV